MCVSRQRLKETVAETSSRWVVKEPSTTRQRRGSEPGIGWSEKRLEQYDLRRQILLHPKDRGVRGEAETCDDYMSLLVEVFQRIMQWKQEEEEGCQQIGERAAVSGHRAGSSLMLGWLKVYSKREGEKRGAWMLMMLGDSECENGDCLRSLSLSVKDGTKSFKIE